MRWPGGGKAVGTPFSGADAKRRGIGDQRIQIEMPLGHRGEALDQRGEIGVLAGLHEAEMAFRQSERRLARHRAEHRNAERGDRVGDQRAVLFAGRAIENDAGDAHRGIVRGKTPHHGRRRLRLPRYIEHQHDRKAEMRGEIGGRAAAARDAAGAVEQAHHAFDDENIRVTRPLAPPKRRAARRGMAQVVEIDARCADGGGVECRVDVIRTGFCRAHFDAAPRQRRQHGERHGGLAGAGVWRGDDEAARRHFASLLAGAFSPMSRSRMVTMSPITTMAGGSNSCSRASPASFSSVDTSTRCRGVVAEAITAAGVAPASPAIHQCGGDPLEIVHHHVEHDRLAGAGERRPVEILVGAVTGGENDRAVDAAQRRRNGRRGERRKPGGDAGNDAEGDARRRQRHRLLAAAAEHEGIAALEPQHALPGARQRDQPLADIGLDRRRLAAALAGKFEPRLRSGQRQDALIDQRVVNDDVGLRQAGQRIEREQARIARPGAGEPDMARLEDRNAGALRRQGVPCRHDANPS